MPFGNDGDFSDAAFMNRVNSNLANEVGNLAMRTLSLVVKNCKGRVPHPSGAEVEEQEGRPIADLGALPLTEDDKELLRSAGACLGVVRSLVGETQQLHKALDVILQVWEGEEEKGKTCAGHGSGVFSIRSFCLLLLLLLLLLSRTRPFHLHQGLKIMGGSENPQRIHSYHRCVRNRSAPDSYVRPAA